MTYKPPRAFVSYSHDSQAHKDWVLNLAHRLMSNGVDIVLDQWDLRLGGDLGKFMESGLTDSERILCICTPSYVKKSNNALGGVGFEKTILTAQVMQHLATTRIVPIVRAGSGALPLPTFMGSRVYVDFRDDEHFEEKYIDLIRDLHGESVKAKPPLGPNPFQDATGPIILSTRSERYVSSGVSGVVTFDYSNNDGRFVIGSGNMTFETAWSSASNDAIHAYRKSGSIRSLALAVDAQSIESITDASAYDTSSWSRTPHLGEVIVWQNTAGYFAATKIEGVGARSHGREKDELTFSYVIQPNKSASFIGSRVVQQ